MSFNPHTHEGCDRWLIFGELSFPCFNPHTHEGCDQQYGYDIVDNDVSIHTPTKGVTLGALHIVQSLWRFNPHTHEGCDTIHTIMMLEATSFNPHTHEGCDSLARPFFSRYFLFQSTHPRRVWRLFGCWYDSTDKFQSTHPRRVWRIFAKLCKYVCCFNPHTHEGCDMIAFLIPMRSLRFQSTHPRRVWPRNWW